MTRLLMKLLLGAALYELVMDDAFVEQQRLIYIEFWADES
jgi:hypothetical protein